ncbi:hypothetical protein PGT21_020653 [Puccinia graminis f. sp. tritici]|uniref:Uncharacterized protein n=1 Tax=Puccinia graminis f. sp. tritici TaxID=56615 RepID=A0A5B0P750_PUCGR|nr:hypothetical protein PGT21_020653 [Puccinia graminis f. sp. tritici]
MYLHSSSGYHSVLHSLPPNWIAALSSSPVFHHHHLFFVHFVLFFFSSHDLSTRFFFFFYIDYLYISHPHFVSSLFEHPLRTPGRDRSRTSQTLINRLIGSQSSQETIKN